MSSFLNLHFYSDVPGYDFSFIFPGVCRASWICGLMSFITWNSWWILGTLPHFFFFFSELSVICLSHGFTVPSMALMLISLFHILYFLFCLLEIFSLTSSCSLLILSYTIMLSGSSLGNYSNRWIFSAFQCAFHSFLGIPIYFPHLFLLLCIC